MNLSIIIVNYKTKELTKNCINSIIENTKSISYEIILIDNASNDGSCEDLKKLFPNINIIINNENLGFAKANNQGILISKGKYILLLNSDTIILNECLQKTFEFAETVKNIGIIGCKVLFPDGSLQPTCYHHPNIFTETIFFTKNILKNFWDPISYWKSMKYWNHKNIKSVDSLSGCFFWLSRELIDTIGMLDENFFMYYEDAEFCKRTTTNKKFSILYYPEAVITHYHGSSTKAENTSEKICSCFSASLYYFYKSFGYSYYMLFRIICRTIWKFELLFFSILKNNNSSLKKVEMLNKLLQKSNTNFFKKSLTC